MQHGKNLKWFQELEAEGEATPAAYQNMPHVNETYADYWAAFQELSGSRPIHMGGMGEIPYSVVSDWLTENEIFDRTERGNFRTWIRTIDRIYMQIVADRNERKRKESQSKCQR